MRKVARFRDCKIVDIYVDLIKLALSDPAVQARLDEDAAKAPESKSTVSLEKKTPEQLQAAADKAKKQLDAIMAKLQGLRTAKAEGSDAEPPSA